MTMTTRTLFLAIFVFAFAVTSDVTADRIRGASTSSRLIGDAALDDLASSGRTLTERESVRKQDDDEDAPSAAPTTEKQNKPPKKDKDATDAPSAAPTTKKSLKEDKDTDGAETTEDAASNYGYGAYGSEYRMCV